MHAFIKKKVQKQKDKNNWNQKYKNYVKISLKNRKILMGGHSIGFTLFKSTVNELQSNQYLKLIQKYYMQPQDNNNHTNEKPKNIFRNAWQTLARFVNPFRSTPENSQRQNILQRSNIPEPNQIIYQRNNLLRHSQHPNQNMIDQSQQIKEPHLQRNRLPSIMLASSFHDESFGLQISKRQYQQTIQRLKQQGQLIKQCGICYIKFKSKNICQLSCEHQMCYDCLKKWIQSSFNCPFCRQQATYYWLNKQINRIIKPIIINDDENQVEQIVPPRMIVEQRQQNCCFCHTAQPGDYLNTCSSCNIIHCHTICEPFDEQLILAGYPWYCLRCR